MGVQASWPDVLTCSSTFRLFIPIEEDGEQHIYVIDKDEDGNVVRKKEYGVRYVPLTDHPDHG